MTALKIAGGTMAAVAAMGLALPTEAQSWHRPRHHRHHDRIDAGDVLLGGLIVGGIAALIGSSKHKQREREAEHQAEYDAEQPGETPPPADVDAPASDAAEYDGAYDTETATDRCAAETETLGRQYARLARVSSVTSQVWNGRSWVIKGTIELAQSYADPDKQHRDFRCSLKAGSDPLVSIQGLDA